MYELFFPSPIREKKKYMTSIKGKKRYYGKINFLKKEF